MSKAKQLPLFSAHHDRVVNVASVPQRSPFRYPGGKTWLVPRLRAWFRTMPQRPALFIEPFAGGGIASLTVAAELLADRVCMVELDADVAAVWHTILSDGGAEWLADTIVAFRMSHDAVAELFARPVGSVRERAFTTIVKNRVSRGGILAPGAGLIKYGENGKGILSRWYPQTLANRIREIAQYRDRITFLEGDGLDVITQHQRSNDAVFFVDPPYTVSSKRAGSRLYRHSEIDHELLFRLLRDAHGDFLMTYDKADEVMQLAARFDFDTQAVAMKNTHHAEMTELLIGRNFAWSR